VPSISKRAPKLACVAAFVAVCVIGWVTEATLAQDPAETPGSFPSPDKDAAAPAPVQVRPSPSPEPAKLLVGSESPASPHEPPVGLPSAETVVGLPSAETVVGLPSAETVLAAPTPKADLLASGANSAPESPIELSPINDPDDPEKAAMAFVEQNQKLAESQLKNLKDEQAKLRARLQKVEGGIKRWEALVGALKQSQGSVVVASPANPASWKQTVTVTRDDEPQDLDKVAPDLRSPRDKK
jgi:hypothetical protein